MTRNLRTGAHGPSTLDRARTSRKEKPYKVVLESVTQEKRKVQYIETQDVRPPAGYGYVLLAKHTEITEWCKEQCRQRGLKVYIVSLIPDTGFYAHADENHVSHHVHRSGHHFPLEIIHLACKKFGYMFTEPDLLEKLDGLQGDHAESYFERGIAQYEHTQRLRGRENIDVNTKDSISGAVREMFPKIPDASLTMIVDHAFKKGTKRVGTASDLPLARRIQLAVGAHIRHVYTDYDERLRRKESRSDARAMVEHLCLAKLKEWRDETSETSGELEEAFREVIVLDDSDDEDDDDSDDEPVVLSTIPKQRQTGRQPYPPARPHAPRAAQDWDSFEDRYPIPSWPRDPPPIVRPTYEYPRDSLLVQVPGTGSARPLQARDAEGRLYNLQPIEPYRVYGVPRQIEPIRRPVYDDREVYERPPMRGESGFESRNMRLPVEPPSRRASDHEMILPSVEHETLSRPQSRSGLPYGYRPSY